MICRSPVPSIFSTNSAECLARSLAPGLEADEDELGAVGRDIGRPVHIAIGIGREPHRVATVRGVEAEHAWLVASEATENPGLIQGPHGAVRVEGGIRHREQREPRPIRVHDRGAERQAAVALAVEPKGVADQELGPVRGPDREREDLGRIDERHLLDMRPVWVGGVDIREGRIIRLILNQSLEHDLAVWTGNLRLDWSRDGNAHRSIVVTAAIAAIKRFIATLSLFER